MIHRFLKGSALSIAAVSILLGACNKDEPPSDTAPAQSAGQAKSAAAAQPSPEPAPKEVKAVQEEIADYFFVEISHAEPKPGDPVKIAFPEVRVVSSSIDPNNMTAASAELEIGMTKLDSGIPKRDGHLGSPDYFDTSKFGTASIKVKDVKVKDDATFTATSDVTVHGVSKSWEVEFAIVETTNDSITIEAKHDFSRLDFEIGKASGDSVATEVQAKLRVTLPTVAK